MLNILLAVFVICVYYGLVLVENSQREIKMFTWKLTRYIMYV